MRIFLATLLATLSSILRSRAALELENLALRHQIGVLQRSARKRSTGKGESGIQQDRRPEIVDQTERGGSGPPGLKDVPEVTANGMAQVEQLFSD
jgi:hypothetical protein